MVKIEIFCGIEGLVLLSAVLVVREVWPIVGRYEGQCLYIISHGGVMSITSISSIFSLFTIEI
ncbi:hypothetical protein F4824DRAFT_462590 [Ustulina deusta]|nr:hypothetical protein F4824DRAFT_462590 [Ustulina deusta]